MQWQSRQQLKFQALLAERAHCFRHNLTENERILCPGFPASSWASPSSVKFPVDRYILDFVAPAVKLAVEVDDRSHELKRTADAHRDRTSRGSGIASCGFRRS